MSVLLLAGDAMLGRGVDRVIHRQGPAYPLEPLAPVTRAADLFFANLECAITPRTDLYSGPPKAFYFRAAPPAVQTLLSAGVDLVSLANNHALDADSAGLLDTLELLDQNGIACVGAGPDLNAAAQPAFLQSAGQRFGVLAYCDHQEDFTAAPHRPGIRYVDLGDPVISEALAAEVAALAPQVDHVIIAFHWMPNWVRTIPPFYRSLAHRLVSAGARVIWGHSPHHFLGVEWLGDSVVLYSSGGLVDDYALHAEFRNDRQILFQVTLDGNGARQVLAYPLKLEFGRTHPANREARRWIAARFTRLCAEVGSQVEAQNEWLQVLKEQPDAKRA